MNEWMNTYVHKEKPVQEKQNKKNKNKDGTKSIFCIRVDIPEQSSPIQGWPRMCSKVEAACAACYGVAEDQAAWER